MFQHQIKMNASLAAPEPPSSQSSNCPPPPPPPIFKCPPPPPPPSLSLPSPSALETSSTPSPAQLTPFHWRPVLRPPPRDTSLWTHLPSVKFDEKKLQELFHVKASDQRKVSSSSKQKPKILNVLDFKVIVTFNI